MNRIFDKYKFFRGRLLSFSKSLYREKFPYHEIYFNANIFIKSDKIWFGDLDLTLDRDRLILIAKELKQDLYILREMDGRFDNEKRTFKSVKEVAVDIISGT